MRSFANLNHAFSLFVSPLFFAASIYEEKCFATFICISILLFFYAKKGKKRLQLKQTWPMAHQTIRKRLILFCCVYVSISNYIQSDFNRRFDFAHFFLFLSLYPMMFVYISSYLSCFLFNSSRLLLEFPFIFVCIHSSRLPAIYD